MCSRCHPYVCLLCPLPCVVSKRAARCCLGARSCPLGVWFIIRDPFGRLKIDVKATRDYIWLWELVSTNTFSAHVEHCILFFGHMDIIILGRVHSCFGFIPEHSWHWKKKWIPMPRNLFHKMGAVPFLCIFWAAIVFHAHISVCFSFLLCIKCSLLLRYCLFLHSASKRRVIFYSRSFFSL